MRTSGWIAKVSAGVIAVGAADLVTKLLAERHLAHGVALGAGARLQLSHNTGMAFGTLAGAPQAVVASMVVACVVALAWAIQRGVVAGGSVAVALVLGGALANLVDRLEGGGVTDFIDLGAWPSFNVADAALTTGIAVALWRSMGAPAEPAHAAANATEAGS